MLSWFRKKQHYCSQDLPRVSSTLAEARDVRGQLIHQWDNSAAGVSRLCGCIFGFCAR